MSLKAFGLICSLGALEKRQSLITRDPKED